MNFFKNLQTGRKLFGIVLLISVAITGVLFGFVFLAKQQPKQEPAIGGSDSPPLDISDWQTYRNPKLGGIVFQYPIAWVVDYQDKRAVALNHPGKETLSISLFVFNYENILKLGRAPAPLDDRCLSEEIKTYHLCGTVALGERAVLARMRNTDLLPIVPAEKELFEAMLSTIKDSGEQHQIVLLSQPFLDAQGTQKRIHVQTPSTIMYESEQVYILSEGDPEELWIPVFETISDTGEYRAEVSPGSEKKFIYFITYSAIGQENAVLFDEEGSVIAHHEEMFADILDLVKGECQCGYDFRKWETAREFSIEIRTAKGNKYKVLYDAMSGERISEAIFLEKL